MHLLMCETTEVTWSLCGCKLTLKDLGSLPVPAANGPPGHVPVLLAPGVALAPGGLGVPPSRSSHAQSPAAP